ncbi:MAG: RNA polymerase factor sigma-54 [Gammaproteobacteria bacterium]|nr:MAG: RNA polymerase factor sigma-54 [Gammaproteobacteria bacterium]
MTPQLQQAIKLLQLSSLDLQTEIQQAIENNPMLEIDDTHQEQENPADNDQAQPGENPDMEYTQYLDQSPAEIELGMSWQRGNINRSQASSDLPTDFPDASRSLKDHLQWQLDISSFSPEDHIIASAIIDSLDEYGYLTVDINDLHRDLTSGLLKKEDQDVTVDEVMAVLHMVQHLDPPGIGAIDLQDCLRLQLEQLSTADNERTALAYEIVCHHFDALSQKNYNEIAHRLNLEPITIHESVELIRALNPRPGTSVIREPTEYVVPDVIVQKIGGKWHVFLNNDISPQLSVNQHYASLIRRADDSRDNQFLKNNLQEARWFIKSLSNRNETLLKVANIIMERQQEFLEHGEEFMKPLVLRDIADAVDMHESTISRVTTQKYMHTPRGVFEFKYFFSSHVGTADGGECSSTAIRAMIKKLVGDEDMKKPLSDNKIAQMLEQKGIKVARRTVAKYREGLLIPPSNERRLRA